MKYFHSVILIFVICVSPINSQEQCPIGKSTQSPCDSGHPCPLGSICYRNNKNSFCCGKIDTFCPTKMHAINTEKQGSYLWGPNKATKKENWYNVSLGNETIACPIPHSFTYTEYTELKVLPVDFEISEKSKTKSCKLNSDCHVDKVEFCGASFHPTYPDRLDRSGPNGATLRFCYKSQSFGTNVSPLINRTTTELTGCDNHSECIQDGGAGTFCFIMDVSKEFQISDNKGKITSKKGFCSMAHVCDPEKHISIVGSLSKTNSFCQTNEDCEGSKNMKRHPGIDSKCVSVPKIKGAKLCCSRKYEDSKVCQVGKLERPIKTCSNFEDCNKDGNDTILKKWCDEQIKHCCQDEENKLWSCPDGATPIFNEPKCEDVSPIDIESGKCSQDGGICRYGHCCPQLMRKNETEFSMALKQYITNIACKSDEPVPEHFNYAFCDPDSMKVVILGTLTVDGQEIGTDGAKCRTNKECKENEVCIKRIKDDRFCIWNPLKIYSNFWWYMLAASIVGAFLFAGLSISFYIAHRRKSNEKVDSIDSPALNLKPNTGKVTKTVKKKEISVNKTGNGRREEKKVTKVEKKAEMIDKKVAKVETFEKVVKENIAKSEKNLDTMVVNSNFPFLNFDSTQYENIYHPAVNKGSIEAATSGLIVDPKQSKYMGNTDKAFEQEKEKRYLKFEAEMAQSNNENSKTQPTIEEVEKKVTIKEDKCLVYETDDVETYDEDNYKKKSEDTLE